MDYLSLAQKIQQKDIPKVMRLLQYKLAKYHKIIPKVSSVMITETGESLDRTDGWEQEQEASFYIISEKETNIFNVSDIQHIKYFYENNVFEKCGEENFICEVSCLTRKEEYYSAKEEFMLTLSMLHI